MLTQCPSCQTVFRVTGAILRMGHGQVRCGSCRTQFDALECLLDDEDEELPARTPNQPASSAPTPSSRESESQPSIDDSPAVDDSIEAREPDFAEDVTLEGSNIEISGVYRIPPEQAPDHTRQVLHEHVVIERNAPPQQPDEEEHDFEIDLSKEAAEQALDLQHDADTASARSQPPLSKRIWGRQRGMNPAHSKIAAELDELTFGANGGQRTSSPNARWWIVASIALVIVLALQVVHHHRDDLVRHPKLGPTVTRLYHAVGLTLQPQWELKAYELQQWGVLTDAAAPDTLRVRASITNRATFAQPYPLIKLALQDRWGAPVGVRAFEPNEYLPAASGANRLLAPKQRANAEIVIVDPGADAVGFQIHACLQYPQAMVCSDDLPGPE
jgi:predicted Zn finger-like uncharacterized protein